MRELYRKKSPRTTRESAGSLKLSLSSTAELRATATHSELAATDALAFMPRPVRVGAYRRAFSQLFFEKLSPRRIIIHADAEISR